MGTLASQSRVSLTGEARDTAGKIHGVQRQFLADTGLYIPKIRLEASCECTSTLRLVKVEVLKVG